MSQNRTAIMQPYFFPYLGYFQLINAVDCFVFYEDVHFMKKGWIHRNRTLVNKVDKLFTVPLKKASQNKLIYEIDLAIDDSWRNSFFKNLEFNYKSAPYYQETIEIIYKVLDNPTVNIAELASSSIIEVTKYLDLRKKFFFSSKDFDSSRGIKRDDRLIQITKELSAKTYINPSNGRALYDKDYFWQQDVELLFIENQLTEYNQGTKEFISGLSIIDVLMFNSVDSIKEMLKEFKLI